MAKLRDRKKLRWCLRQVEQGKATQKWLAQYLGATPRRFKQIYRIYKSTNTVPPIVLNVGRPKTKISSQQELIVIDKWNKHHVNALYLETIIDLEQKQRIPHNTIHKVMLAKGYASEQESKQERHKPWIRYEREHSLSAVHMDWHISKVVPGKQVCVGLDDASRKILSGGEFSNATAENSFATKRSPVQLSIQL